MSAIRLEVNQHDWRAMALAEQKRNVALLAALRQCAKTADLALTLAMPRQVQADLQSLRSGALDAIAANKEIPKC